MARPDQNDSAYVTYTYTRKGNPVTVKAPKQSGTYEIRYILGRGRKILAREPIIIE